MRDKSKKSIKITTMILLFPLITLLFYGGLSHIFFFYSKQEDVKQEINRYENALMMAQQSSLIEKVENLTQFIRYYNFKSNDKIKREIKNYVNSLATTANSIYYSYKNIMSEDKLKSLIIKSLQNIFQNSKKKGRYFFLLDSNGTLYIHPDKKLVGKNVLYLQDISGKYIIKEFLGVIENEKEGFVDYYWYKPDSNSSKMFYKISFVKSLDMYNWIIGSGEYLKDMLNSVSQEMLRYIKDNAFFKDGYFFISNSKNRLIFHPYKDKSSDLENLRLDGVYRDNEKIAYTSYVAEYDWYITAVKSMYAVKEEISKQAEINRIKIKKDNETNIYIIVASWFVSLMLSLYLSLIVTKMLSRYEKEIEDGNQKLIFQSRQALIGELFSMIAHQWRQPINKIASIVAPLRFSLYEDNKIDKESFDRELEKIEESVEFMSDTIDDFRTFYKPKNIKEPTNLKELIEKSVNFLSGSIHKKDVKIIMRLKDVTIKTYANELLQVLINVIKNAIDAVEQRGIVEIKIYSIKKEIVICIKDNGHGIPKESLNRVFEPYFTTKSDSMGLGLYMCKLIIEKHLNGTIEAFRLKKGTEFKITLPTDD